MSCLSGGDIPGILFSKATLSGQVDKREVPVKRKQLRTYVITANENTSRL